ncbi:DUF1543 domain-containing protein [Acidisoma silvae]|uniref:DUF1543 domain-containing protein n=1 Tax=Acidisoma silvae TaxID=2802396 RepID=A0A963YU40_9PROT|nr:DUF1543 domain-containing protein [Acidisoma silvae]MCB8876338.1 DUF1543 domain-containing protein [Acidisoma silvae]
MQLFMVYVGGSFANSNTELHDVRFSVGAAIEDCYDDLRAQWWGTPASLHLDAWAPIAYADGYTVSVEPGAAPGMVEKLFFINLGGYTPDEFGELHRNILLVAPDAATAKQRALAQITPWSEPHRDQLFEVEHSVDLSAALAAQGLALHLRPTQTETPFSFDFGYRPIGRD